MKLDEIKFAMSSWEQFADSYNILGSDRTYLQALSSRDIVSRLNGKQNLSNVDLSLNGYDKPVIFPTQMPRLYSMRMTSCRVSDYSKMPVVDEFTAFNCKLGPGIVEYSKSRIYDLTALSNSLISLNDLCLIMESGSREVIYTVYHSESAINLTINKYNGALELSVKDNKTNSVKRIVVKSVFDLQDSIMQMQLDDERYFVQ